jgi:hypothetical protein
MKLLHLLLLVALYICAAARTLPQSLPLSVNVSHAVADIEPFHRRVDWHNFDTAVDTPPTDPKPADPKEEAIWCRAVGRGRMFVDAMKLNEDDAAKLLGWPHVQSTWDGPLYDELRKWGYLDTDSMHQQADSSCDFADFTTAFKALGVDVRSAKGGGPNHCFHFSHGYGPAMERDANGKLPRLPKQTYVVDGVRYPVCLSAHAWRRSNAYPFHYRLPVRPS